MLDLYRDRRGYRHTGLMPREGRPVTITEDEVIELDVEALSRDVVMSNDSEIILVQIIPNKCKQVPIEELAFCTTLTETIA